MTLLRESARNRGLNQESQKLYEEHRRIIRAEEVETRQLKREIKEETVRLLDIYGIKTPTEHPLLRPFERLIFPAGTFGQTKISQDFEIEEYEAPLRVVLECDSDLPKTSPNVYIQVEGISGKLHFAPNGLFISGAKPTLDGLRKYNEVLGMVRERFEPTTPSAANPQA